MEHHQWNTCIVMVTAQPKNLVEKKNKNIRISGHIQKPKNSGEFIRELTMIYAKSLRST
jgi:hypothetical protein